MGSQLAPHHIMKRIVVRVPDDLFDDVARTLPYGVRRHVVEGVLRLVVDTIDEHGEIAIGAMMAGKFRLSLDINDGPDRPVGEGLVKDGA